MHSEKSSTTRDTILVVDDDAKIVRLVRSYLEQSGYQVETAYDGNDVMPAIRSLRPSLIILDLNLPGQDGLVITNQIRSDAVLASTPILMLTARIDDVDRILGLEMGADDYVTKPFNPREVVARVKAILRRTRTASDFHLHAIITVGQLQLDPQARTVEKNGSSIELTPSEYEILYLLMRNPGTAFSRTQIIEQGLGYEYEGLERTVDSHVKNLRRKIEDDASAPRMLETVFGIGYRLRKV